MVDDKKKITEDVPVTTTDNGGSPLNAPQLPLNKGNLLTRYRRIKKQKSEKQ